MTSLVHHFSLRALATIGVVLVLLASGTPVQSQDKGAPPWGEFLKRFNKDPLLKTPYHMEEADAGPKGLAAKIRARELDIPNRKRAIRYLADLNCAQFPEAKQMLLEMLNPEKERWEEVRYEAALGLRDMLARNACGTGQCQNGQCQTGNCQTGNCQSGQCGQCQSGGFGGAWERCCDTAARTVSRSKKSKADEGMCYCTNCCDAETMQTLAKTAYEMKEDGCCYEPSLRVRQMAVEAIRVCGIPCNYAPYYATEEAGPMPTEEVGGQQQQENQDRAPARQPEQTTPDASTELEVLPRTTVEATPIARLTDICIVSLKEGRKAHTDKQFRAEYRGRVYYFSSAEALGKFERSPEEYAVAFGGCDPVTFVASQKITEGRYLVSHEGRFYMFSSQENYEKFKAAPGIYSGQTKDADWVASR